LGAAMTCQREQGRKRDDCHSARATVNARGANGISPNLPGGTVCLH
jgi:hypothetical protein